jgi:hypothetical protein
MACARQVTGYRCAKVFILVAPTTLFYDLAVPRIRHVSRRLRNRGLGWIQEQLTWTLWKAKWHCKGLYPEFFSFLVSVSYTHILFFYDRQYIIRK